MLPLLSAGNRSSWKRRSPRGQSSGRRRYHSIAKTRYRRRSTGTPGSAGNVADVIVRGAVSAAGVRASTSLVLRMAERKLFRYSLSERFELDVVARLKGRRIKIRVEFVIANPRFPK